MDPPSPFKISLLALHLRAATRRAAIAGSTPPDARELILSDRQSADGRESVVMCPPVGSAVGGSWCLVNPPARLAAHSPLRHTRQPPQQPPAPCVPDPHRNPPPPQTPPGILLLTQRPASGLPHLGPWGRPASAMGPDVTRWWRVALTHKPVADRLLLQCTGHLLLTQLA